MATHPAVSWLFILGGFGIGLSLTFWLEGKRQGKRPFYGLALLSLWIAGSAFFLGSQELGSDASLSSMMLNPPPTPWQTHYLLPPPPITVFDQPTSVPVVVVPPIERTAVPTPQPIHLLIPALQLDELVQIVPLRDGGWDVSQLGSGVGWLESTGSYPGDSQAMVFIGHMTFPSLTTLEEGAFAYLQTLTYGSEVIYQAGEKEYRYVVREIGRVPPDAVEQLYLADGRSLLLVTCTDWDFTSRRYTNRLLVRATQVN